MANGLKGKSKTVFVCQQCGNESPKWAGRCSACGEWDSLVENTLASGGHKSKIRSIKPVLLPESLAKVESGRLVRFSTGIAELDRALGGGLVPGQVVLVAGEPGIGKSTLLLQVGAEISSKKFVARSKNKVKSQGFSSKGDRFPAGNFNVQVLYVSGEESPGQIKLRADRLGIKNENIQLLPETNVERIIDWIEEVGGKREKADDGKNKSQSGKQIIKDRNNIALIIVDSVQTLWSEELTGIPGAVGQVRLCSLKLIEVCKAKGIPLFLVGQVTKEGVIAGPKVLEHAVDTVLYFEGERMEELRLLRCFKNRFGNIDELAVFKMGSEGLMEVSDASRMFIDSEESGIAGAAWCPVIAGVRILLVEIQSLVVSSHLANPRRIVQGVSRARVEMVAAVLQKHLRLPLYKYDLLVNVAGGLTVDDPGVDLAIAASIYSSLKNRPLKVDSVLFGELTLLGGVRSVLQSKRRIEESKRLGLRNIYSSETSKYLQEIIKKMFA